MLSGIQNVKLVPVQAEYFRHKDELFSFKISQFPDAVPSAKNAVEYLPSQIRRAVFVKFTQNILISHPIHRAVKVGIDILSFVITKSGDPAPHLQPLSEKVAALNHPGFDAAVRGPRKIPAFDEEVAAFHDAAPALVREAILLVLAVRGGFHRVVLPQAQAVRDLDLPAGRAAFGHEGVVHFPQAAFQDRDLSILEDHVPLVEDLAEPLGASSVFGFGA